MISCGTKKSPERIVLRMDRVYSGPTTLEAMRRWRADSGQPDGNGIGRRSGLSDRSYGDRSNRAGRAKVFPGGTGEGRSRRRRCPCRIYDRGAVERNSFKWSSTMRTIAAKAKPVLRISKMSGDNNPNGALAEYKAA
jgi:hypothetical protein